MEIKKLLTQSVFWRVLNVSSLLATNVFLSRYFHAANMGWIFYLINTFSLALLVMSLSIESGITFFASSNKIAKNRLVFFSLIWTIVIAVLTCAGGFIYFGINNTPDNLQFDYLFFALCFIPGTLLANCFTALFYTNRSYAVPNIILFLLNIILLVVILIYGSDDNKTADNLINLYFLYFLIQGLMLALVYIFQYRSFSETAFTSFSEMKLLFGYSVTALLANVLFFLVYRVDYWFVEYYCSKDALGNYIQASKLGQLLLLIPNIIAGTVFPETARKENAGTHLIIPFLSRCLCLFFLVLTGILFIAGKWLFVSLFGPSFNLMYALIIILLPGILSLSILAMLSAYLAGRNNIPANIKGSFLTLLIIIAGDIALIPRFGINAAAAISSLGYTFHLFYNIWQYRKYHLEPWTDFLIPKKDDFKKIKRILSGFLVNRHF
ncbi:MAG: polysaccharide biosynthesis C-terminal domain-containing protein [Panacibacter sp.]